MFQGTALRIDIEMRATLMDLLVIVAADLPADISRPSFARPLA
jgi:hypothetical protein